MTVDQTEETRTLPAQDAAGEPCAQCGAPLADDQRWCLNCGRRRTGVTYPRAARKPPPEHTGADKSRAPIVIGGHEISPLALGSGLALFAVALLLGILIGNGGDGGGKQVAAAPQVIRVSAPPAAAAAQPASLTSDWPDGQNGYTVQLQALPKSGTQPAQVDQAKSAAQSKGAADVGALDSDQFSSLGPGNYVVYAGVFDTRKRATKALGRLKSKFPAAKVVKVSAGGGLASQGDPGALSGKKKSATVGKKQLEQLKKLSPDQYQKKSRKLPDNTKLPGKAPPKDNKKPGGGGGGQVIG